MEPYLIDQSSYEELQKELKEAQKKFNDLNLGLGEAIKENRFFGDLDGVVSNEVSSINDEAQIAWNNVNAIQELLNNCQIVEHENSEDIISVGTTFRATIKSGTEEAEVEELKLIGGIPRKRNEVTLNSALGKAINQRRVGESFTYEANGIVFDVTILEKLSLTEGQEHQMMK